MALSTAQKVSLGFGITFAVIAVITLIVYIIYDHNLKNEALDAATYATTAQTDVQDLLDSVSCLKQYYKTFEYFDANGEDKKYRTDSDGKTTEKTKAYVSASMEYQIGGATGSGSGELYQIRKSITPELMVSKLGISQYYTESDTKSTDYIRIYYYYPDTSVQKGVNVDLSKYSVDSNNYTNENMSIQEYFEKQIEQNWQNAFSGAEDKAICSV